MCNDDRNEELIKTILQNIYNAADAAITALQCSTKHIYIFGAGAAGVLVKRNLERFNLYAYRFVDNNISKHGTLVEDIPVIGFSELLSDVNRVVVIGTVEFHHEVVTQCIDGGIPLNDLCFADFLHYDGKEVVSKYFLENISSIVDIFEHCADHESRDLFIANLLYQINRDRRYYRGKLSPLSKQYFDSDIVQWNNDEVYFDCGAKDGDTALIFHNLNNGIYKKIITFEPDKANFEMLMRNTESFDRIENINAGVGEFEVQLAFNGDKGGHSAFDNDGAFTARIVPLDKFIDRKPTFIKMDIEGFELSALMGAKEIIQTLKPKLAICLYHKPRDIVSLPKYILSQRSDYKLYLRLYRDFGHDLVCYCV
ncbi:FkbM family methyltransferase [Desulfitobacterium hafniense]|uniref:FkbM family methyltransferase n=1 Tax=Desulfitobacterium hafniense TaxID=49338 RepID=UPI00036D1468|nr:FkbM family methyltransferase [Desulfitobacterium hafniense]